MPPNEKPPGVVDDVAVDEASLDPKLKEVPEPVLDEAADDIPPEPAALNEKPPAVAAAPGAGPGAPVTEPNWKGMVVFGG